MSTGRLFTSILAAAIVCRAAIASPQTADEVVEKHLAAMGGRAALEKITSRVTTGTISVSTPGGDLSGTIEVYNKAPNKTRTLVKIDASQFGIGQIVQDQRFDGTTGYAIDTLNGNREITGEQADIARSNVFPSPLMKYKEIGSKLELVGREKVGPPSRVFIDADTYVLTKTVITVNVPQLGTEVEQTTLVSDYRDVDGIK